MASNTRQQTYGIESLGDSLLIYRADGTPYLQAKEKVHPTKLNFKLVDVEFGNVVASVKQKYGVAKRPQYSLSISGTRVASFKHITNKSPYGPMFDLDFYDTRFNNTQWFISPNPAVFDFQILRENVHVATIAYRRLDIIDERLIDEEDLILLLQMAVILYHRAKDGKIYGRGGSSPFSIMPDAQKIQYVMNY
eukprot:TRINITY_DN1370_c0_g1_i1.p1 TRINITY_DN1370_c0_g1~~TRINITY_DN1370_c0_g1_i1.p1  ORF type:complete len:193 (+),score=31.29 TRINITY_DN1370_c0_g1_i1:162-740(+)